jgi:hypothetical protein
MDRRRSVVLFLAALAFASTVPARSDDRDELIKRLTDRVISLEKALSICTETRKPARPGRVLLEAINASSAQALINASWIRVEKRYCDATVASFHSADDALTSCAAMGPTRCVAIYDDYCTHSTFSLCAPGSLRGYGVAFDGVACVWIDPNRTFSNSTTLPQTQTPSSQLASTGYYSQSSGRCSQVQCTCSLLTYVAINGYGWLQCRMTASRLRTDAERPSHLLCPKGPRYLAGTTNAISPSRRTNRRIATSRGASCSTR